MSVLAYYHPLSWKLPEAVLIFSPAPQRVDLEALSDTAGCLRASPAELGKREKCAVICMQKLEYRRSAIM